MLPHLWNYKDALKNFPGESLIHKFLGILGPKSLKVKQIDIWFTKMLGDFG